MWAGVGKSGSPISRWMMLRPCASSARAFTSTSKADSTPMRLMRSASFINRSDFSLTQRHGDFIRSAASASLRLCVKELLQLLKERRGAPALDCGHSVAERHARALNSGGHAAASGDGDYGGLIRRLV